MKITKIKANRKLIKKKLNTQNRSITTILWHYCTPVFYKQSQNKTHTQNKKIVRQFANRQTRSCSEFERSTRPPIARLGHTMLPDRSASTIRARYNERPAPARQGRNYQMSLPCEQWRPSAALHLEIIIKHRLLTLETYFIQHLAPIRSVIQASSI